MSNVGKFSCSWIPGSKSRIRISFCLGSLTVEQRASKKSTPISIKVASEKNYAWSMHDRQKGEELSNVCFDVQNRLFSIRASKNLYIKRWILFKRELKKFPYRRLCTWPQFGLALKRGPRPTRKWSHMIFFNLSGAAPLNIEWKSEVELSGLIDC